MSGRKVRLDVAFISDQKQMKTVSRSDIYSRRAELLASRASLLTGRDRAIIKMYLKNGSSFRQIASITGASEATVARRINKLISRLIDTDYIICLQNRDAFSRQQLTIARDYFLGGLSQKSIACKRGLTVYIVRKAMQNIQQVIEQNR